MVLYWYWVCFLLHWVTMWSLGLHYDILCLGQLYYCSSNIHSEHFKNGTFIQIISLLSTHTLIFFLSNIFHPQNDAREAHPMMNYLISAGQLFLIFSSPEVKNSFFFSFCSWVWYLGGPCCGNKTLQHLIITHFSGTEKYIS